MTRPQLLNPDEKFKELSGRVDDLYKAGNSPISKQIREGLLSQFEGLKKSGKPEDVDSFLGSVEDIFKERKEAIEQRKNVLRQLGECDAVQINTDKADLLRFANQQQNFNPKVTIEEIKAQNESRIHLSLPPVEYRQNVMYAGLETQDKIEMNMARLNSVIDSGVDISEEEKKALSGARSGNRYFKEKVATFASAVHGMVSQATKGILTSTAVEDSRYAKEYSIKKEKLMTDLMGRLNVNHSNYSAMMERLMMEVGSSSSSIEAASYCSVRDAILSSIKEDAKDYEARMKKFNEDAAKAHEAMLEDMQKCEDKSGEMLGYRLLSMFLVFTPLGAFSIAGHVFNYLEPLSHIFGPLFEAHKTFGQGFGDAITSKEFGVFGQLMDKMEIDKAVTTVLDKTPILGEITDAINTLTDSPIGQGLMAEVAPMIGSPLLLLGIGGSYALSRAPEELAHHSGKKSSIEKHDKALGGLFKSLYKELEGGWEGKNDKGESIKHEGTESRIKKFADAKYKAQKDSCTDAAMGEFFVKNLQDPRMEPFLKAIFGDVSLKVGGKTETLFEMLKDHFEESGQSVPRAADMIRMIGGKEKFAGISTEDDVKKIQENGAKAKEREDAGKKFKEELRQKFLLLSAIDRGIITTGVIDSNCKEETLRDFKRLSTTDKDEAKQKVEEVKKEFDQQFATQNNEISFKKNEVDNLKKFLKIGTPTPFVYAQDAKFEKLCGAATSVSPQSAILGRP